MFGPPQNDDEERLVTPSNGFGDNFETSDNGFGNGFGKASGEGYHNNLTDASGGEALSDCRGWRTKKGENVGFGYGYGRAMGRGGSSDFELFGEEGDNCSYEFENEDWYSDEFDITTFNHKRVHIIDDIPTIIYFIHGRFARGAILNKDMTTTPTYIAKVEGSIAHGKTLEKALKDAKFKAMKDWPLKNRIAEFIHQFPSVDTMVDGIELFKWHGILTGSCTQGREQWCEEHHIDPRTTRMTVKEFCHLVRDSYGKKVIRNLIDKYHEKGTARSSMQRKKS